MKDGTWSKGHYDLPNFCPNGHSSCMYPKFPKCEDRESTCDNDPPKLPSDNSITSNQSAIDTNVGSIISYRCVRKCKIDLFLSMEDK